MSFYFNNIGEFRYKIKGNLPMEFDEEVIKFLVKEKFPKFSFIERAKGNQQNLTFKYMDNCTVNDVKEHIDWAVCSAVQKYGYTDTSHINEKNFDIENYCKFEYELNMG